MTFGVEEQTHILLFYTNTSLNLDIKSVFDSDFMKCLYYF